MNETQADKLLRFTRSVNIEVGEHISKIIDEANKISSEKLEKAEDDALLDSYKRIQKSVRETESKYRRMYALAEQKYRMDALRHREELSLTIFKDVENKLSDFAASEKYVDYLKNIVAKEKLSECVIIALSTKDKIYSRELEEKYGLEVRLDDSIKIGGLLIIDPEQGYIIDKTFDSALEEQRKSFSSRYSFKSDN